MCTCEYTHFSSHHMTCSINAHHLLNCLHQTHICKYALKITKKYYRISSYTIATSHCSDPKHDMQYF